MLSSAELRDAVTPPTGAHLTGDRHDPMDITRDDSSTVRSLRQLERVRPAEADRESELGHEGAVRPVVQEPVELGSLGQGRRAGHAESHYRREGQGGRGA